MRMTLEDRLKYGTSEYLELTTSYLGASPECPGGAETLAKIKLAPDRRIINVHLLDWLIEELAERDRLLEDLEATMDAHPDFPSLGYDIECRMAAIKDSKRV